MKKLLISMMMALVASLALTACNGEQKFTADDVQKVSEGAATRAALAAKQEEAAKTDAKWIRARAELRQMGATAAATGKYLIVDNCNVKPDGFSQLQANKDFPSSAFVEFRTGCTDKVYAMKADRDKHKHNGMVAEQKRQQKVAAAKLKACEKIAQPKQRDACRAEAKRHA